MHEELLVRTRSSWCCSSVHKLKNHIKRKSNATRRWNDMFAGRRRADEMKKTGRTRTRSRGVHKEGQRQPDFADTEATPDIQGTPASAAGDVASMEGTPPEEDRDTQGEAEAEGRDLTEMRQGEN
eukprot:5450352-Pleurochrysis_carterae.AAC.1